MDRPLDGPPFTLHTRNETDRTNEGEPMPRQIPKRESLPAGTISTMAAARVAGLHWRTLLRWVERGTLTPRLYIGEQGSQGSAYAWNVRDVVAARTIRELRAAGLSAQKIRKAARVVLGFGHDLSDARLYTDGRDVMRILPDDRLMSVLRKPGQHSHFPLNEWAALVSRGFDRELSRRDSAA